VKTFALEISTPTQTLPPRVLSFLDVPAERGRLTVLAGHQSLVCVLRPGIVRMRSADGDEETLVVGSGTMTVSADHVSILAESLTT